ncbi:MAG: right-handed parallel beta-helix repeat-containing protein [Bacteroidales bacterium]|nr:right-handed parallel beta-helix repeat-containing protein [Bacteroidales bacterium]
MEKYVRALLLALAMLPLTMRAADFDVHRYGAKGDGVKMDTQAIQKAIDACNQAGGGRVVLSDGTFLTGAIHLKSGVELHIDATARLLASPDIKDFPNWPDVKHFINENLPRKNRNACVIFADEADNIAITGRGVIDGNGTYHVRKLDKPKSNRWAYERIYGLEESLPRVVFLAGCKNVLLEDVTMVNQPAGWGYWVHDCDRVTIRGLKIFNDKTYPNNDGIHLNCSRDVTVSDCQIECGDDCIVLRANSRSLKEDKVMERATITNCILSSNACAIRVAWTNDGIIRNCTLSNLEIYDTNLGISIHMPYREGTNDFGREATHIENLDFSNIRMTDIYGYPVYAVMDDERKVMIDAVQDISFTNVSATSARFPYFHGREETPFRRITFSGCTFIKKGSKAASSPGEHISGLIYDNCIFSQIPDDE